VRAVRDAGYLVLQYWFFYAMNDWRSTFSGVNDHEADWEQIILFLTEPDDGGDPDLAWVAFSAHDEVGDDLRRRIDDPDLPGSARGSVSLSSTTGVETDHPSDQAPSERGRLSQSTRTPPGCGTIGGCGGTTPAIHLAGNVPRPARATNATDPPDWHGIDQRPGRVLTRCRRPTPMS
jgi:hypothetical protein